ncbi:hypothetical protein QML37_29580 [Klebsiella pneumoniae]|uniref:hypothetical protein n=1 Tax=Klebsiella pneumoniae TaxID=573 RepID=UPI003A8120AB
MTFDFVISVKPPYSNISSTGRFISLSIPTPLCNTRIAHRERKKENEIALVQNLGCHPLQEKEGNPRFPTRVFYFFLSLWAMQRGRGMDAEMKSQVEETVVDILEKADLTRPSPIYHPPDENTLVQNLGYHPLQR